MADVALALFAGLEPGLMTAVPLFLLGLVLVIAEVFIPSGGAISVLAAGALITSIVFAFHDGTAIGFSFLAAVLVITPLVLIGALRVFPDTALGRKMIPEGNSASADERKATPALRELIGQTGTARTVLRPSGRALIAGEERDVETTGEMLDAGTAVQVVAVEGHTIVVRAVKS